MSLYSNKSKGAGAVQPWSQVVTLAEAGKGCDGLFNLYESLGDKTLVGVNTVTTSLDGPEKVVRYGTLMLGDGTAATSLTASQRCKGLTILCDSLTVKNNATLQMTGRGARVLTGDDPFFPFVDYRIPFKVMLDSTRMTLVQVLGIFKFMGLAPWDIGTFQHIIAGMFGFNLSVNQAGTLALMLAAGCGQPVAGYSAANGGAYTGNTGQAGSNGAPGSGGSGGCYAVPSSYAASRKSGAATPYSGGAASGGIYNSNSSTQVAGTSPGPFSGPGGHASSPLGWFVDRDFTAFEVPLITFGVGGGGAGNPGGKGTSGGQDGGNGVGGKLTIICRGTVTIQPGGKIESNGMPGGGCSGVFPGGAGSGGGHVSIIANTLTNAGTIQAAGGTGGLGNGAGNGGAGGAGSVVTKTFSDMGW